MQELEEELRKIIQRSFRTRVSFAPVPECRWHPLTDVFETGSEFVVKMELPGVDARDIRIILEDKRLVVQGVRQDCAPETKVSYQQMEINYGPFRRVIILPSSVQSKAVRANYRNGFLEIKLPFADEVARENMVINIE